MMEPELYVQSLLTQLQNNDIDESSAYDQAKIYLNKCQTILLTLTNTYKSEQLKKNITSDGNTTAIASYKDISFSEPRGKFNIILYTHGLSFEGKNSCFIPWVNVSNIIRIPSNVSTKKEGEDILLFHLSIPISFNNKDIKNFMFTMSNTPSKVDQTIESNEITLKISETTNKKITIINKSIFQTVLNQKSYLRCYKGTQEGALYPLKCRLILALN